MALNFGILSQVPSFGQQFAAGQQAAQAQQERNMLRQAQAEQMQFQRENMLAQREDRAALTQERQARQARAAQRQQFLTGAAEALAQGGNNLDRPTLMKVLQSGVQAEEPSLIQFARESLKALDEEELYQRESQRLSVAPGAPATPEEVQNRLRSPSSRMREQGKALLPTLPTPEKPVVVGGNLVSPTGQVLFTAQEKPRASQLLTPEEEAQKTRIALASRPPPQPREAKDDPRAVVAFRETDAAGNVTLLNKFGQVITPTAPVKGKPSATFEKTTAQRKQLGLDLDRAITELTDATKKGGLIDQSTGSGAGRLVDIGAGFVGQATPGAIAGGKLAPIADLVLKMVPRFEGPQSDKDTTSYKEAAGQLANTALPNAIRKQAGLEILRLMKERKGQFVSAEMAAEGTEAASAAPAGGGNFPAPPAAAIDALRRGQGTDAQFDAIFGPGAAVRARGR
jgi:ribosomal protein L12E/L44/L45/RPP1/RPP2